MIHKPDMPTNNKTSCIPISLLPVVPKLFETSLLKRLIPIFDQNKLISYHRFGFGIKQLYNRSGALHHGYN